eukprot:CAMPEP_0198674674 /NCGR_PEP_ID=MMETSP1467-20131203/98034_1 /TAXON_ID=1462469 /ORGANISM="unid. sp., Strain CCMP2135" /LENGTH=216 /DNA_ID=CAMNT_0044411573 /DNA_START=21 /DNA_END=667 /DNA_ORIENTATION=+
MIEVFDAGPASASAAIDVSDVGSAADSGLVLLGARVQGDFLTGHANVSALGTTLRCAPRRSQCATFDACGVTLPLPYANETTVLVANETTVLVTLATSPAVDFDFCPLGVYARAQVDLLFTPNCPSPSPTTILQGAPLGGSSKKSSSSSSKRRRRRFARIVCAAIVVASGAMMFLTAAAFAWVRVLRRSRQWQRRQSGPPGIGARSGAEMPSTCLT